MAVYTVHEPRRAGDGATSNPERFVFVRDGFSFAAMLFGPLWMLRHRMWLVLLGYTATLTVLGLVLRLVGASDGAEVTAGILLEILVGFEAGTLHRLTLASRGFRNVGVVVGDDLELVERRFFDAWAGHPAAAQSAAPASAAQLLSMPLGSSYVIGLFPESGAQR
jgi:hypothetical protein